mgnify:CR=1 FL=1
MARILKLVARILKSEPLIFSSSQGVTEKSPHDPADR